MSRKPTSGDNTARKKISWLGPGFFIVVLLGIILSGIHQEIGEAKAETTPDITIGIVGPRSGVWGGIGPLTSAASLPASGVYHAAGIPQITPSSTDPRLTEQGFRNLFRTCGRDDQQGQVAARFVLDALHPRRVVVLHDQTAHGRALADTFSRQIMRRDSRLLATTFTLSAGGKNIASVLEAIKAKEPDVIYFGGIYREGGLLVKQLREHGVKATFVRGGGVMGTEFISLAGDAAMGTYLTFAPDPLRLPSTETVMKKFQNRYGAIGPYRLNAYDAAGALFTAIARAKPKAAARPELLGVFQVLHRMTYMGALGMLRWNGKGDLVNPAYVIYQTRKGGSFQGWFEQVTGRPPQPRGQPSHLATLHHRRSRRP